MRLLAILIAAFLLSQPQAGSIEGTVVQIGTMQPVARAVVQAIGGRSQSYTIETGGDGRFRFAGLPRGQYEIKVSRTGYMDAVFGQRGPSGRGRTISIETGQTVKDVLIAMVPYGAISGRIIDDRGEPVANINVEALRYVYEDGNLSLRTVKSSLTDDRGEYRLFWLPPGEYYLKAAASAGAVVLRVGAGTPSTHELVAGLPTLLIAKAGEAYTPAYYPAAQDPRSATRVEVRPGADLGGLDFTLTRVATRKVRGVVIDGATGQPPRTASVMLVPRSGSAGPPPLRGAANGAFEFQNVHPGSYFAVATVNVGGNGSPVSAGRASVEVTNSDVEGVVVTLSPGIVISGTIEGLPGGPPAYLYPSITLKNEVEHPRTIGVLHGAFRNTREFNIEDVIEGDYWLHITFLPDGRYVKSARFGAIDLLNETLHVDSRTSGRLEIVLGADVGQLAGAVVDRSNKLAAGAVIALLPTGPNQQRQDLYKNAFADESGRFEIRDIAPGDYVVFAWEAVDESVWRDPEFLRRNEGAGRRIHIGPSGRETVELTAF